MIAALDCFVQCGADTGMKIWSAALAACSCVAPTSTTPAQTLVARVGSVIPPDTGTPINATPSPTPETQSCHSTCHGLWASYSILIRVPFGGKSDCDATFNAIDHGGPLIWQGGRQTNAWPAVPISNWQCVNEDGNIRLWFNAAPGQSDAINPALEWRYPNVAGGFNCPDC